MHFILLLSLLESKQAVIDFMSVGARCCAMQTNRTYEVEVLRQLSVG